MGTVRGRQVRFRVYSNDHPPIHAHGRIGAGEVVVELDDGVVYLSQHHRLPVRGNLSDHEITIVLSEASDFYDRIVAEWERAHQE